MVYMESAPLFCVATQTTKYMVNNTMQSRSDAPYHPLEQLWEKPMNKKNTPNSIEESKEDKV